MSGRMLLCRWSIAVLLLGVCPVLAADEPRGGYDFHHENVLGTSLHLRVVADSQAAAEQAESRLLAEIDRLDAIFSTYRPDSEFSRWQRSLNEPVALSPELLEVLGQSEHWQRLSDGAFNPAAELFSQCWQHAAREQRSPSAAELAVLVAQAARPAWRIDATTRNAVRLSSVPLSFNALAKGYIIDRCGELACDPAAGVTSVLVNIGGDLRAWGALSEPVDIADPFASADNAPPRARVLLCNGAMATSGNYRRGFVIRGRRRSHIIDPRTGLPVEHIASASVLAPRAADADALATIFCVLQPAESLRMADSLPQVECLLIGSDGHSYRSAAWPEMPQTALAFADEQTAVGGKKPAAEGRFELRVEMEINRPEAARYLRPYVAVWIEDSQKQPVRTLALWVKTSGSGPTWVPDLRRWYRGDLKRLRTDKTDFVATRSEATRAPGKYSLVWDGLDDQGRPVAHGEYMVMIEAAREQGTYQVIRKQVTLGKAPFKTALEGNIEIRSASLEYRPVQSAE